MLNIVIPMAGEGTRLDMFDVPKILVDIGGKPMLQVAVEHLPNHDQTDAGCQ